LIAIFSDIVNSKFPLYKLIHIFSDFIICYYFILQCPQNYKCWIAYCWYSCIIKTIGVLLKQSQCFLHWEKLNSKQTRLLLLFKIWLLNLNMLLIFYFFYYFLYLYLFFIYLFLFINLYLLFQNKFRTFLFSKVNRIVIYRNIKKTRNLKHNCCRFLRNFYKNDSDFFGIESTKFYILLLHSESNFYMYAVQLMST